MISRGTDSIQAPVQPVSYAYAVAPGDDAWLGRAEAFVEAIKQDGRLRAAAIRHKLEPIALLQ